VTASRAAGWALVLLVMVVVAWIRVTPQSLGVLDDRADTMARVALRERLARELPASGPPSRQGAEAEELAQRWIDRHPGQFKADAAAIARRFRSDLSYAAPDGREHVYLGDYDSYLWLRHARNYLRTGTPCDAVVDGACRDTYTNAPVGARTPYARSLHVAAIVGVHDVIAWLRPGHPLPASAFLVPVIVGVFGVIPAFSIARRLAGNVAGAFAGLLTAVHPIALVRTIGSDNDVWNLVLPLYVTWAAVAALAASTPLRAGLWAGLAGVVIGLHAWTWRGWPFAYTVVMIGLAGAALSHAIRYGVRARTVRVWNAPDLPRGALVLGVIYAVAGAAVTVTGSEEPYLAIPLKAVGTLVRDAGGAAAVGSPGDWPSALSMVAEVRPLQLTRIAQVNGGPLVFLASLLGLLLMLLPPDRWRWWHRGAVGLGVLAHGLVLFGAEPGRAAALALPSAPLVAALVLQWWVDEEPPAAVRGATSILIVWFLAAVLTAYGGMRFVLLLVPPFGIACAVLVGRAESSIRRLTGAMPGWYRVAGVGMVGVLLLLVFLHPVRWGYSAARRYTPVVHDAWWDALTRLRDTARPDAIVHTWWDYGHWVKYVADRRVSNDGSSVSTHVPHWIGRALVAPTEAESVGVLRMLSCGSDATPLPEGAQGAYGKVLASGRDPVTAYAVVADLLTLDAAAADHHLAQRGFAPAERAAILGATHCEPPEGYLVLSDVLVRLRQTWVWFGQWDPRARPATRPRPGSPAEEAEDLASRPEPDPPDSGGLTGPDRSPATGLSPVPFVPRWLPCHAAPAAGEMVCDVHLTPRGGTSALGTLTYRVASPLDARLHGRERREGVPSDTMAPGTPAAVLLAGAERMEVVGFTSPTHPDLAVLIDVPGERVLVGAPALLRSTFVHLMYLDGRYARHYQKHDDRKDSRARVVTWKISWKGM
jgi:hypothetical protein